MKSLSKLAPIAKQTLLQSGYTLVELLVGLVVASTTLGLAFTVVFFNRNLYVKDNARINTNQNLRTSLDIIGSDIRQAGEYITDRNFPVLIVQNDPMNGDTLTLRRGLEDTILPVCINVSNGTSNIAIAIPNPVQDECSRVARDADPTEIWPDNIYAWQNLRSSLSGNQARAFIFDVDNSPIDGEYFIYSGEVRNPESTPANPDTPSTYSITSTTSGWTNSYSTGGTELPSLALLEERKFYLDGNNLVLEITDTEETSGVQPVAGNVTDFQVTVTMQDGTVVNQFSPGDNWSKIASVDVTLSGETSYSATESIEQTLTSSFLPRNVLSFILN
ncbi:prepilin-type N-terminal cleavage/methylation domain-containing protein [Synechococcus sp. PCC 7336]|uniref:prepilin-type N-terminal cleavage/methylation domain-containing protein n=1 Tax=Synechococcus sp. PCC 7336 TaxID=195250 RepID=UPI00034575C9|nr:prepilin-type N-terminal cleavage/methylation domain-containing protein [Synechococcus sp. PCC 7336]